MPRIRTSSGNISANTWSRVWGGGIAGATGDDQSSIELKIQNRGASSAIVYVSVRDSAGDPPSTSDESVLYSESVAPDGILQIRDDIASLYSVHVRATQDATYQISGPVDDIAPPQWLQDIIDVAGEPYAAFDFTEQDYRLTGGYPFYKFGDIPNISLGANAPNYTVGGLLYEDADDLVYFLSSSLGLTPSILSSGYTVIINVGAHNRSAVAARVLGTDGASGTTLLNFVGASDTDIGTFNGTSVLSVAGAITSGTPFKAALRQSSSARGLCVNGSAIASDANAGGSYTEIWLGQDDSGSNRIGSMIVEQIIIYTNELSDAQMQAITS